jgi:hypothetical protein
MARLLGALACCAMLCAAMAAVPEAPRGASEAATGATRREYSQAMYDAYKGKRCTNLAEVQQQVGFTDISKDPYPRLWYNTVRDLSRDCYVVYAAGTRAEYELKTMTTSEVAAYASGREFFRTHFAACGMCSQLEDLAVFLEQRDLTVPVRRCGLMMIPALTISCLKKLGFTPECRAIWFFNVGNTKKLHAYGGCFGVCMTHVMTPNGVPVGDYNPCKPHPSLLAATPAAPTVPAAQGGPAPGASSDAVVLHDDQAHVEMRLSKEAAGGASGSRGGEVCHAAGISGVPAKVPSPSRKEDGFCGNTINGRPACSDFQWQNGEFRLNPCLQCDECRSGPIFQKISGRTRRNSGIETDIKRPDVAPEIYHNYA